VKVGLFDPAVLERHFAPQRGADAVHDAALDLRPHDVRVDDAAAAERHLKTGGWELLCAQVAT